ncbi:hypothetical protein [Phaffia rhodozyma]|uniref:Uncharacterized protein n=1 Tax=Phaffia rhodozyma TaxID=264483 RepID=A0A0F7SPZ5_PHARH|nr:hypothetical protein [Phaffia rhodozyma]
MDRACPTDRPFIRVYNPHQVTSDISQVTQTVHLHREVYRDDRNLRTCAKNKDKCKGKERAQTEDQPYPVTYALRRISSPPSRSIYRYLPQVPIPTWGLSAQLGEEIKSPLAEEERWWFEQHGHHSWLTAGEKRKRQRSPSLLSSPPNKKRWRHDWSVIGRAFDLVDLPHVFYPRTHTFPPVSDILISPFPTYKTYPPSDPSLPLSLVSSGPSRYGEKRVKWLVPIHGPVWGLPNDDTASQGRLVVDTLDGDNDQVGEKLRKIHQKMFRRIKTFSSFHPVTTSDIEPSRSSHHRSEPPPPSLDWTPTILSSFHTALQKLSEKNQLGPISVVLHHSTFPSTFTHPYPRSRSHTRSSTRSHSCASSLPSASTSSSTSSLTEPSPQQTIHIGDHYRIYVDLTYASHVRSILDSVDLRFGPDSSKDRCLFFKGARLVLVDDVGTLLCLA